MKTRAKQTAHRLAAVLAIATAFATSDAWAADNLYWTGAALDSRKYEVTVKDGALVLNIYPDGMTMIVR